MVSVLFLMGEPFGSQVLLIITCTHLMCGSPAPATWDINDKSKTSLVTACPCSQIPYLLLAMMLQLFFSFFKTLVGKEIAVELKNDVVLTGTLHSVDQYLNIKLTNVSVVNENRYPQLTALKNCFIRGSVVRYVQINPSDVDTELLQDATRKENSSEITATTSSSVEVKS